jgi:hypothetical protein
MGPFRRIIVTAYVLAAMVTMAPQPTAIQADSGPNPDANQYSKSAGVTYAEAVRQLALQPVIGALQETLVTKEGSTFAGLFIEHQPRYRVVARFTSDSAATLNRYISGGPLDQIVESEDAAYSLADLEATQARLIKEYAGTSVTVDIDVRQDRVAVGVPTTSTLSPSLLAADAASPSVQVTMGVQPRTPATTLYGGLQLSGCTSGFTIYYGTNKANRGIVTAGHCSNSQSYAGHALTYQNDERHDGNWDYQSHKLAGATYQNKVQDGASGTTRSIGAVTYWVNQNVGDFVCKYGYVTHYGCGYIVAKNASGCVSPPAGTMYIKVDSDPNGTGYDLAEGGDSGGPWFLGSTAKGITSCQQGFDALYESIGYVEVGLPAHVLLTP